MNKNLKTKIGFDAERGVACGVSPDIKERINLNLSALGEPICGKVEDYPAVAISQNLLANFRAKDRLMRGELRSPVDMRIEAFIKDYLKDVTKDRIRLPGKIFNLNMHGIARTVSLPADGDEFHSDIIDSYRLANGVLHNPVNDRRTTQGVFHVAEGGLPIPNDKKAVPKQAFAGILQAALQAPDEALVLPFTANQEQPAKTWVSLLLRPLVCPEVPGLIKEKRMEIRFFAPGSMVCNLDFVESIFGNGGDPFLPENDAALDIDGWSGHTGCVILAPHVKLLKKKDLGLPHISEATDRQKRDGMCWESEDECYNDGGAFKITARTEEGIVVTVIADNYFGYCKKEVKTQIGFAANLMGISEEEHAGGTLAFTSYDLGEDFQFSEFMAEEEYDFEGMMRLYADAIEMQPEGYGIDRRFPNIFYLPNGVQFSLPKNSITWQQGSQSHSLRLNAGKIYILPSGYKVQLIKPGAGRRWRLIGTMPEPTNCHKPCTVSGGGKSEISKSIGDAIIHAPFYVDDLDKDFDTVESILKQDFSKRFKDPERIREKGRPILGDGRSLGSVIKLLTPSYEYTDEHNAFVAAIPARIKELILLVKRFYRADWGDNWRDRFSVDIINGQKGHELKYRDTRIVASYLRVGYDADGSWRVFSLRKDFAPAEKIQTEDDITASVVVPWSWIPGEPNKAQGGNSVKLVQNCEFRLFQRPDDAIIRGYDKKTEEDMATPYNFFSNYQPLTQADAAEITDDAVRFDHFTEPMKKRLLDFVSNPDKHPAFIVANSNPRLVNGKPSKNPRYLQTVLTLEKPVASHVAEMGARFRRRLSPDKPVLYPVNGFLPGHRNNPPEEGVRSLAVFNPVHYLPLPEAFMEFTSSMTGKSPSTTGAGSEGAMTKGPFNALLPITDLNNALVAAALTGLAPYITAAGCVGPNFRVDHDISLLIPEEIGRAHV